LSKHVQDSLWYGHTYKALHMTSLLQKDRLMTTLYQQLYTVLNRIEVKILFLQLEFLLFFMPLGHKE